MLSSITIDIDESDGVQKAWVDYPIFSSCTAMTFDKNAIGGFYPNLEQFPMFPDGCDSRFQAICMTDGEWQTTTAENTSTTNW